MSFFGGRRQQEEVGKPAAASKPAPPPPAPRQPAGFQTVLGSTTVLNGDLRGKGNVRLDGLFEGALEIDGNILVGETAKITADINARNISIAGAVHGNVNGNKVQILRTGRVWGDISATAITTEEGAFIDGKITMLSHEAAAQKLEPALQAEAEPDFSEPDFLAAADEEPEFGADVTEIEEAVLEDDEFEEAIIVAEADLILNEDESDAEYFDEDDMVVDYADEDYEEVEADEEDEDDEDDKDLPIDEDGAIG